MSRYALCIGINYTGTSYSLNGCVNDAHDFANFLRPKGYQIVLMTDEKSTPPTLQPTRTNILHQVDLAVSRLVSGDTLVFTVSSHGGQSPDPNSEKGTGSDDTIFALGLETITDEVLKAQLVDRIPRGAKLRAFSDACHSGSDLDIPMLYTGSGQFTEVAKPGTLSDDCILVAACADSQTDADAWEDRKSQGALTWSFLKSMGENPSQTWSELLESLREKMFTEGFDQTPQLSVGRKDLVDASVDV